MLQTIKGLFIIIFILGLMMGCSADLKGNVVQSETKVVESHTNTAIPYKQLLYSKHSSNFAWGWSDTDELPKELKDKYKDFVNAAPGGFIVKETSSEYFICVSIGAQKSVTEGFKVKSLTLPDESKEKDPSLKIEVTRVANENTADKEMKGEVFVTSLIRVAKEDLPDGFSIRSITLGLDD